MPAPASSGRLKTLTGPVLAAWYVALLLPTLAFKLLYISVQSGGDPRMIEPAGASAHISIWWLYVAYFLPADFLDVLVIVAIGAVAGVLLLRIPVRYVGRRERAAVLDRRRRRRGFVPSAPVVSDVADDS